MRALLLLLPTFALCACQQFDLKLTWDPTPRMYETSTFRADRVRFRKAAPGTAVVVLDERAGFDVALIDRPAAMRSFRAQLGTNSMRELGTPLPTVTSDFDFGWPLGDPDLQAVFSDAQELAVLDGDAWTARPFPPVPFSDVLALYVLTSDVLVVATPAGLLSLSGSTWRPLAPELGDTVRIIAHESGRLRLAGVLEGKGVLLLVDAATGQRVEPDVTVEPPYGLPLLAGFNGTVDDFVVIGTETYGNITTVRPLHFVRGALEPLFTVPAGGTPEDPRFLRPDAFRTALLGVTPVPAITSIQATRPDVLGRPGFSLVEEPVIDEIAVPQPVSVLECTDLSPVCPEFADCRPNPNDNGKGCYVDPVSATVTWRLVLPPGARPEDFQLVVVSSNNPTAGPAPVTYVRIGAEWELRLQPRREVLIALRIAGGQDVNLRVMAGEPGSVIDLGTVTMERRLEVGLQLDRDVTAPASMMDPLGGVLFVSASVWKLISWGQPSPQVYVLGPSADQPGAPVAFPVGGTLMVEMADGRLLFERAARAPLEVDRATNNPRLGALVMARESQALVLPTGAMVGGQSAARFVSNSPTTSDTVQTFNQAGDSDAVSPNGQWFARRQGTSLAVHDYTGARFIFGITLAQPVKLLVTNDGERAVVLEGACVTASGAACSVQLLWRNQPSAPTAISSAATLAALNEAGTAFVLEEAAGLVHLDVASGTRTPVAAPGFVVSRSAQWGNRLVLLGVDRSLRVLDVGTGAVLRSAPSRARAFMSAAGRVVLADACSGADPCAVTVYTPWDDALTDGAPGSARGPFIGAPPSGTVTISGSSVTVTTPGATPPARVIDEVPGATPTFDPLFDDVLTTAGAPCAIFHREGRRFCAY